MHWAEKIAREVIARDPNKKEFVVAAGISPSGSIHIGNFRDVATSLFVAKMIAKQGKKVRFLFSWDELDRFRKVPKNVQAVKDGFEQYFGRAYVDIPNPFDTSAKTYAEFFEHEFIESLKVFNIELDYKYQAQMYRSGKYVDYIIKALKKRGEIFDILDSHRTQESEEGQRESYYPVNIYCAKCGRDTTRITKLGKECTVAQYECDCGHSARFDFKKDYNCKLAWKIDWPMRWAYEGVDFEPGGKDHASLHGSYDTSKDISMEVFGYRPPYFQGYEFIGIKGLAGKMSGSSGLNLTPSTLLKTYQPELLLWLYAKVEPERAFDFCFDEGILNQYFEYDKMFDEVAEGKAGEFAQTVIELATIKGRKVKTVPMALIVQLGAIVDFNPQMMEVIFAKIGEPYTQAEFADRVSLARYWLEVCATDSVTRLNKFRCFDYYDTLTDTERLEIRQLFEFLQGDGFDLDSLRDELYAIPKRVRGVSDITPEIKKCQSKFFANVYNLLIGKPKGPRLYLFLFALDKMRYMHLLDFSTPRRADEVEEIQPIPINNDTATATVKPKADKPDTVEPIKSGINITEFAKIDVRACTIIKCSEIRKSHSCYKIVVNDGIRDDRVIVSSIKDSYSIDELVGRKILVVCNLEPARIAGVTSEGMLLACENGSCGTQVIFVDSFVPNGTRMK